MRLFVTIAVAVGFATAAGTARGDAGQGEHNCAGAFSSGVTPEFVAGGAFGASVAGAATAGTRDDAILALVDALANCGEASP